MVIENAQHNNNPSAIPTTTSNNYSISSSSMALTNTGVATAVEPVPYFSRTSHSDRTTLFQREDIRTSSSGSRSETKSSTSHPSKTTQLSSEHDWNFSHKAEGSMPIHPSNRSTMATVPLNPSSATFSPRGVISSPGGDTLPVPASIASPSAGDFIYISFVYDPNNFAVRFHLKPYHDVMFLSSNWTLTERLWTKPAKI